jgi:hypothetical protein
LIFSFSPITTPHQVVFRNFVKALLQATAIELISEKRIALSGMMLEEQEHGVGAGNSDNSDDKAVTFAELQGELRDDPQMLPDVIARLGGRAPFLPEWKMLMVVADLY